MGDYGTLVRMEARLRRPNLVGDTNTVRGTVTRTYRDGDEVCYADVEVENVNQSGAVTASGLATVKLPARGSVPAHSLLFAPTAEGTSGIYN